jgi:hypothetical protein
MNKSAGQLFLIFQRRIPWLMWSFLTENGLSVSCTVASLISFAPWRIPPNRLHIYFFFCELSPGKPMIEEEVSKK